MMVAWWWCGCATAHAHEHSGFAQDREGSRVPGVFRGEGGLQRLDLQHPRSGQMLGLQPGVSGTADASLGFHPAPASQHHASCVSDSLF